MTSNSVKPLYLIINKVNGFIDEHNGNNYLTLLHTDNGKDILKSMEETMENYGKKSEILLGQQVIAQAL